MQRRIRNSAERGNTAMIVDKLNDIINSCGEKSSLKSFCLYVRDNIYDTDHLNVRDIAEGCYLSKGQISKCIRHLGYDTFADFKDDCVSYKESLTRKKSLFDPCKDFSANILGTTQRYVKCLEYTVRHLDYQKLSEITGDIMTGRCVYLYGQGEARGNCYNIQRELKYLNVSVLILDESLKENVVFDDRDLMVVISTNGQLFQYNERRVRILKSMPVRKWLVTCNRNISFCNDQFVIPSQDPSFSEMIMTYVLNMILMLAKTV